MSDLQATLGRLLETQRSHIADSELSAANIARYINQGLDAMPLLETGVGSRLRAGAARVGAKVGQMYERARTTVNEISSMIAPDDAPQFSSDPATLARITQVASRVAAASRIPITPTRIERIRLESRRVEAEIKEAIQRSAPRGGIVQLMMRLARKPPIGTVTRTVKINGRPEAKAADEEELEWDDEWGRPGGPPDDDDPEGGGGGGEVPEDRIPFVLRVGGRTWTIKGVLKAIALVLGLGVSTYQAIELFNNAEKNGTSSVGINSAEKGNGTIPNSAPAMETDHTYEPGPDGKPKLFPGYRSGNIEYQTPEAIPAGESVSRFKLNVPDVAPPPATKSISKDITYGINTDDDTIRDLMDQRPDLAEQIMIYNATVASYNLAKQRGDTKEASQLYNKLKLASTEMTEAAAVTGTKSYSLSNRELEYPSTDTLGDRIMLKHVRTKTARTAALGLDDEIEAFNKAAHELNSLTSDGATSTAEYKAALLEYNTQLNKIDRVEGSSANAAGTVKPKLVGEEYPKRVQELARLAFDNKPTNLSEADIELLEKYPTVGKPVLEYDAFKKQFPETKMTANTIQRKLDAVKAAGFKLQPSARPFAEKTHTYPLGVQKVIDRIAASDGRTAVIISERERQAIAEFPELEDRVAKYENDVKSAPKPRPTKGGRVFEALTPQDLSSDATVAEFRGIQAGGYQGVESVASSIAEVEDKIAQDSADLRSTSAMLKNALAGRAPRAYIEELYRRQNMLRARLAAERADVSGRGTYLGDVSRENLPSNEEERKAFLRLQNVEREFQGRQDALFEYNEAERGLDYTGMTKAQAYDARLQLLESIATKQGLEDVYQTAIAKDTSVMDEDANTVVNLPDDPEAMSENKEGSERAEMIDPDERALFLRSRRDEAKEAMQWEEFSYVPPGFGLGGPKYNTLQRVNAAAERRRFKTVTMAPARQQVKNPPPPVELRGRAERQPAMIPIYESDFGLVHYEDAFHNDYQQGRQIIFTNPYQDDGNRRTWNSPQNIYQPDYAGYAYAERVNTPEGRHMVPIGEVSKPHEYYGTNRRFCDTNGPNHRLQNRANNFPDDGEATMITTERSGRSDLRPRIIDYGSAVKVGVYSTRR